MPENGLALHFLCREWVLKSSLLIAMAVYTYLRLIVDHHGTAPLQALRQKEVDFCISLLRERVSRAEPSVHTAHSAAGGRAASFGPPPSMQAARGSSPPRPCALRVLTPSFATTLPTLPFLPPGREGPMSQPPVSEAG